jgi:hypothetical protein
MIKTLRSELQASMIAGKDEDLKFKVKTVELELQLAIDREVGGSGGVKFWVLSADGKASVKNTDTHRITITLQPLSTAGGAALISDSLSGKPE